MYACALDQTGLLEMKCLPNLTGYVNTFTDELLGIILLIESSVPLIHAILCKSVGRCINDMKMVSCNISYTSGRSSTATRCKVDERFH